MRTQDYGRPFNPAVTLVFLLGLLIMVAGIFIAS